MLFAFLRSLRKWALTAALNLKINKIEALWLVWQEVLFQGCFYPFWRTDH